VTAVREQAAFVSARQGGHGAVRELVDAILSVRAADTHRSIFSSERWLTLTGRMRSRS